MKFCINKKIVDIKVDDLHLVKYYLSNFNKKNLIDICVLCNIKYFKSWSKYKLKNSVEGHIKKYKHVMINYIDLCSGCGGLALGFKKSNKYNLLDLIEINKDCCSTLIKNGFDEKKTTCCDLTKINFSNDKYINTDLITIGSPCQSFSFAGKHGGFKDIRGAVLLKFIEILGVLKPQMFLIENVRGLLSHDNGSSFNLLLSELKKKKYFITYKLLNAGDYGIAQNRHRLFIFGSLKNNKFDFPVCNVSKKTLRDVIYDIENNNIINPVNQTYSTNKLKYFKKIPQGGCWINLPEVDQKTYLGKSFNSGGGKRGILRRLSYDKQSLTILCSPQQKQTERCHPTKDRPLTIRESARIQTFPDNYLFHGSITSQYRQIGNAIPVQLAYVLSEAIYKYWFNNIKDDNINENDIKDDNINENDNKDDNINENDIKDDNINENDNKDDNINENDNKDDNINENDNKYVSFVSDNIFTDLCDEIIIKYKNTDININKNVIDIFKKKFDICGYGITEKEWFIKEKNRQIDKYINNNIGYFHQKLLGNVLGWINIDISPKLKKIYKVDICNINKDIFIELKNKYNTLNGSSLSNTIYKLNMINVIHPTAKCYIGSVIDKKPVDTYIKSKNIYKISGCKLYELITGDKNAYDKTLDALSRYLTCL
jgi:DNA (cytosine-5)-methyltransferase 1